jgi:transposase/predicted nucleic acid-binding protein
MRSRVELFESIRRDARLEGMGVRALAKKHRVHRRTVRQALASAVPPERKVAERRCPVLDAWKPLIQAWVAADERLPKKQRHTAHRVWERLVVEHGAELGESTVRKYVARLRRELGGGVGGVGVPQVHRPGEEAEVDFAELWVWLEGALSKLWLFTMRLSASGRAFHRAFVTQAQEAFFEGHVEGFAHLGGVPHRIRYDNLKPAVARILKGRNRIENERFITLRSHYRFDSFFCQPGLEGAHEKGGVEGEGGRFRRRHLVPIPVVATLAELNEHLQAADAADDARRIGHRTSTVGEDFAAEQSHLLALPAEPFDAARLLPSHRVDHKARICVRQHHYSVPARFAGLRVNVRLGASVVEVRAAGQVIARHERAVTKGGETLVLDHYLEVLVRKPGALPNATALAQAREQGAFTPTHDTFWTACRRTHGDAKGTRALIEILLAHRHLPTDALIQAMRQAVAAGVTDPAVVMVEARRIAERQPAAEVIPIGALARFDRPTPVLAGYDSLLHEPAGGRLDHLDGRGQLGEEANGLTARASCQPHQADTDAEVEPEGVGA